MQKRIQPEDVTINIGKGEQIPKCPIPGHKWKGIVHNKNSTWLALWKDNINGDTNLDCRRPLCSMNEV